MPMKNICRIVRDDLNHIRHNVIALIIILGLAIVPSMYAWFNIAASWDPYGNTGNLKVALANSDQGYQGELFPLELNIGDKIESALRENNDMDWVFTSQEDAIEGTRSGKYYAAFVITETFSKDMMSLFTADETNPVIRYYSNEKENAISPIVTDKVAGALQQKIDDTFIETTSEVIINTFDSLSSYLDNGKATSFLNGLDNRLHTIETSLVSSANTVSALADMTDSLEGILDTMADMLDQRDRADRSSRRELTNAADQVQDLSDTVDTLSRQIDCMLSDGAAVYSGVQAQIDDSFQTLSDDRTAISANLNGLADQVQVLIDRYERWRGSLERLSDALPSGEVLIRGRLQDGITRLDKVIAKQQSLYDRLMQADELLDDISTNGSKYQNELDALAAECNSSLADLRVSFDNDFKAKMNDLSANLFEAGDDAVRIQSALNQILRDSKRMLDSGVETLEDLQALLKDAASQLETASNDLDALLAGIDLTGDKKAYRELESLLSQDAGLLASLWASPVTVDTHLLYEIENYGSSMTPFYTTLSIWVGGIILVAMIKVMVSDEKVEELQRYGKVRHTELYFGRFQIFLLLGLIQTTIICLGDLFFLGVQCYHPFLFLLASWLSSAVYVLIIYTLTISFGDVGKAVAVILLVIQVAGSGGTFPIEVAPTVFQKLYPLLPFVHTMNALRECIAGVYQNTYWLELRNLLLYLIPTLILGLVLRRPIIKMNRFFEEKLEEVKFM